MKGRLTFVSKLLIVVLVVGGAFGAFKFADSKGWVPTPGIGKVSVPTTANLPDLKESKTKSVPKAPLPSSSTASVAATPVRFGIWAWNAQTGLIYANGGAQTTKGSLMEKHGVNLTLYRQDDTNKMQEELIACAKELHDGAKQCSTGANGVIIMGDGAGQFLAGLNPQLKKLGPEYQAVVIGSVGYSRGEDCFMAPPAVKRSPQAAKGLVVSGVLRDGDWNIAEKWAADNGIKNNPDEKTYDPDALNWVNATDYIAAAADYNSGTKCDERKVVKDGRLTGEKVTKCVEAVVTWTPGDVNIVHGKGGLVKVVSSKEYRSQMPAVILGPKAFFDANRDEIAGLLAAAFEGADQVKNYDDALRKGAEISAKVYNEQNGAYWYKYFKGAVESDSHGNKVELGGSAVNNLQDNLILFGISEGANDNFRSTYTTFGAIATQQYPALFKDTPIPDVSTIEDKRFVTMAQAFVNEQGTADVPRFAENARTGDVVSSRSYSINFETGKATLTPSGVRQLSQLKDDIAITGLYVNVDGYTDNQGSDAVNVPLSEARATAVKAFLQRVAPSNFPAERFKVAGHGSAEPVADNRTAEGRARNRRVQITLGQ